MGLLQPAGLGQADDHTVRALGVELPEGEAPLPLIKDPQQGAGLESMVLARSWRRRANLSRSASQPFVERLLLTEPICLGGLRR
jgi:hypothetical protein